MQIANSDRPVALYSLDVIISVGYRVKSVVGTRFRQWANKILKEYVLRGYAVNERIERLERKVLKHDEQINLVLRTSLPPVQGVFYDGQMWDARTMLLKLVASAKRSLILIDNWVTAETLDIFSKKRKGAKVTIFTSEHRKNGVPHRKISDADIATFNAQYPKLDVLYSETFHDRFLIVDDKELYLIGASLKDLGAKCFAFTKLDPGEIERIKKSAFGIFRH